MDARDALHHAGRHAAPAHDGLRDAAAFSPDDRAVRVLLRDAALHDLPVVRQVVRCRRDPEGRRQAPVHHGRLCRIRAADPARRDVAACDGAPARPPLGDAARRDLRDRAVRRAALLVDEGRQARSRAAEALRGDRRRAARLAAGRMGMAARARVTARPAKTKGDDREVIALFRDLRGRRRVVTARRPSLTPARAFSMRRSTVRASA
ncbi:hypothetical protein EMIT0111MI5_210055 [Burkholderia sp. IT-111MI5]